MSKVFEALLKLERESGRLPHGILPEAAQQVFQAFAAPPSIPGVVAPPELPSEPAGPPIPLEVAFQLERVPVERVNVTPEARLVYHSEPYSAGADRFRLLRMRLWPLWEAGKLKTLLVTSALAQDGKSTVVMNLATALAEQGQKSVVVVEGDLYHPSVSERLKIPEKEGLAECLEGGCNPLALIRRLDPIGWYLLPAGRAQGNPTDLLQSPAVGGVFETLRAHFDWIIVDTPPVVPLTDTLSLRQHADAGLMVVRADRTPGPAVEAAIARIGTPNLLGIILNGSNELDEAYSDYRNSYRRGAPSQSL